MSLTVIGAVSSAIVVVPSDVVSVTAASFFLLHAASAAVRSRALATVAARLVVRIVSGLRLCVGDSELETRMDQVRIRDSVAVRHVNCFPFAGIAVDLLGDLAQAIALLDGIGLPAAQGRRAAA